MQRRDFLRMAAVAGIGVPIAAACKPITRVDFGPLDASGVPGLSVPDGFVARRVATTGTAVQRWDGAATGYVWHVAPDGGATFPVIAPGGGVDGWVYVSNSETYPGGAGAIRFSAEGHVLDAYPILTGTLANCAGGLMPFPGGWTWLSCEEWPLGRVFECDPYQAGEGVDRPALGRFQHEAAAADPAGQRIYLTEDQSDGGLYRFTPDTWGDLSSGLLEVMVDEGGGAVGWREVPDPSASPTATRYQDVGAPIRPFAGGEGIWHTDGQVYFTTKGDNRVWRYTPATDDLTIVYDDADPFPSPRHLTGVDNVVATTTNRVFVAEDGGTMEIVGVDVATGATYPIIRYDVAGSEITGPAFSPDGTRLYFSSQRNPGETFEVTGPWNANAPEPAAP